MLFRAKKTFFVLAVLCFILSNVIMLGNTKTASASGSSQELLNETVNYYVNNKTSLDHWEEIIGLANAKVDLSQPPWTLPVWNISILGPTSAIGEYVGTILGMLGAGQDPSDVSGRDLVQELAGRQTPEGDFATSINLTIWAIITLDTNKANYYDSGAINYLISQQKNDGGFALSGDNGDPDITGMALMALAVHKGKPGVNESIGKAIEFLHDIQLDTAGFGSPENAESIASVIRGLIACEVDLCGSSWQKNDRTMVDALLDFRMANGSFAHLKGTASNPMATRQALIALSDLVNGNVFVNIRDKTPGGGTEPPQLKSVTVRVEGASQTLAEHTITVSGTALDALIAAVGEANVTAPGGFITTILGESGQSGVAPGIDTWWMYYVIRGGEIEPTSFDLGAGSFNAAGGDEIIFYIGALDNTTWTGKTYFPVVTVSPSQPKAGQTVTLNIEAKKYVWGSGLTALSADEIAAAGDYTVLVNGTSHTSQFGQVTLSAVPEGTLNYVVSNANPAGYPDVVTCKGKINVGPAGQSSVKVRVEGASQTLAEHTITVSGTALDALIAAVGDANVTAPGGFITTILGESGQSGVAPGIDTWWMYYVIRGGEIEPTSFDLGAGSFNAAGGDEIIFYIGALDNTTWTGKTYFPVVTVSPSQPKAGQTVTLNIEAKKYVWGSGLTALSADEIAAAGDYTVLVNGTSHTSQFGQVTLSAVPEGTLNYVVSNANPAGYPDVVTYKGKINVGPAGSGGSTQPTGFSVKIAVAGRSGEMLYGPGSVLISQTNPFGFTVLGALHATGLSYVENNGFVSSIEGQANSGLDGWMFKVNNSVPMIPAKDYTVNSNDRIIWWYSTDINSPGPVWEDLLKGPVPVTPPVAEEKRSDSSPGPWISDEVREALEKELIELTGEGLVMGLIQSTIVVGADAPSWAETKVLKARLAMNSIDLARLILANEGGLLTDDMGEVTLEMPPGALTKDTIITIKKAAVIPAKPDAELKFPKGYWQVSPVYSFGPSGNKFDKPLTLAVKVALPPLAVPENLVLSRYDETRGRWEALPAVYDQKNGLIVTRINHFSEFVILARQAKKSFADVSQFSYGWSLEPVETLAGSGIISGVDGKRYEPGRELTRAEFATVMVKALKLPAADSPRFSDVQDNKWYSGYVGAVTRAGIMNGYGDGTFAPERNITREELAAVLVRALELVAGPGTEVVFKDKNTISTWAYGSIAAAVSNGIVSGYPDGTFQPNKPVIRAECAVMLYRALAGL